MRQPASSISTDGEIAGIVGDSKGKSVPDTIVFILNVSGVKFPPPKKLIPMDQINIKFVPHIMPVLVGSTVTFPNKDNIHHHIFSFSKAKKFDRPLYKGTNVEPVVLGKIGLVKLGCNIHDTMSGIIFVLQNPYFGITDKQGRYTVRDMSSKNKAGGIPAGKYKLVAWNEFMKSKLSEWNQIVRDMIETAVESDLLFRMDVAFQSQLENAHGISEDLRNEFESNQISLSQNATISTEIEDAIWQITDQNNRMYPIRKEADTLSVYSPTIEDFITQEEAELVIAYLVSIAPELQNVADTERMLNAFVSEDDNAEASDSSEMLRAFSDGESNLQAIDHRVPPKRASRTIRRHASPGRVAPPHSSDE
ncbi:MAG: hypothetical protein IH877_09990 [Gemmatimonadetes bacterium]|nr:hypothetical protein [Gemmatimonadota bacterium]